MSHKNPEARRAYERQYWRQHRAQQNAKVKRWYAKNPTKPRPSRERNKEYIRAYLATHPCIDCKEADIIVLDFDHKERSTKTKAVAHLIGGTLEKLIQEIEKCEVRCANCHRRRTAKQFGWWR